MTWLPRIFASGDAGKKAFMRQVREHLMVFCVQEAFPHYGDPVLDLFKVAEEAIAEAMLAWPNLGPRPEAVLENAVMDHAARRVVRARSLEDWRKLSLHQHDLLQVLGRHMPHERPQLHFVNTQLTVRQRQCFHCRVVFGLTQEETSALLTTEGDELAASTVGVHIRNTRARLDSAGFEPLLFEKSLATVMNHDANI
ncbi:RNA polymerase sigma factor [Kitasatospora fiedleri]|uniref:hypothetical protein n=1 Tax=Kitasatospora fiedleri TaxID=2991545 RepID=UPI00249C3732|nr:hypothetical protein [Kitasatospora fiedleri]